MAIVVGNTNYNGEVLSILTLAATGTRDRREGADHGHSRRGEKIACRALKAARC